MPVVRLADHCGEVPYASGTERLGVLLGDSPDQGCVVLGLAEPRTDERALEPQSVGHTRVLSPYKNTKAPTPAQSIAESHWSHWSRV